jgi:hypothetical protein
MIQTVIPKAIRYKAVELDRYLPADTRRWLMHQGVRLRFDPAVLGSSFETAAILFAEYPGPTGLWSQKVMLYEWLIFHPHGKITHLKEDEFNDLFLKAEE